MLHRKKSTTRITQLRVPLGQREVPVHIYRERRYNWRISMGEKAINLRIPNRPSVDIEGDPVQWAINWIEKRYAKEPHLFGKYFLNTPHDGKVYQTLFGVYTLKLFAVARKSAHGRMKDSTIVVRYPQPWGNQEMSEVIPKLVSRVFASAFKTQFDELVAAINLTHFGFSYNSISYKYNRSNWGSCSSKGNLNFSTRLFLTSNEAAQYVIIHELAHLEVANHSAYFWKVVEEAMPDYKVQEKWLKDNGPLLYF